MAGFLTDIFNKGTGIFNGIVASKLKTAGFNDAASQAVIDNPLALKFLEKFSTKDNLEYKSLVKALSIAANNDPNVIKDLDKNLKNPAFNRELTRMANTDPEKLTEMMPDIAAKPENMVAIIQGTQPQLNVTQKLFAVEDFAKNPDVLELAKKMDEYPEVNEAFKGVIGIDVGDLTDPSKQDAVEKHFRENPDKLNAMTSFVTRMDIEDHPERLNELKKTLDETPGVSTTVARKIVEDPVSFLAVMTPDSPAPSSPAPVNATGGSMTGMFGGMLGGMIDSAMNFLNNPMMNSFLDKIQGLVDKIKASALGKLLSTSPNGNSQLTNDFTDIVANTIEKNPGKTFKIDTEKQEIMMVNTNGPNPAPTSVPATPATSPALT